ncbi:MAG: Fic family protein [Thermomicrobiales bacterium]|nr:Fic family protein [Thermomicrobiales bacterium]MCO5224549.1 Fic family protein [Thermomicrobiales bacterium]MCO5227307.1 Fic family protein [Thermomicrobiales bacterium]
MASEIAALNTGRALLIERFPRGPEADIAQYREWLRTELTYTSNAIEGSTLSSVETRLVIEEDAIIPDKSLREHLEARDHAIAWDYAIDVVERKVSIDVADLLELHQRILYGTNHLEAGYFRRGSVRVAGSRTVFPNPLKVPELVEQFANEINLRPDDIHPVIHAAGMHLDLVKIHPFADGNGRLVRMLMNVLVRRGGYPAIPIYPKDRLAYLNAIERADTDGGEEFLTLVLRLEQETIDLLLESTD